MCREEKLLPHKRPTRHFAASEVYSSFPLPQSRVQAQQRPQGVVKTVDGLSPLWYNYLVGKRPIVNAIPLPKSAGDFRDH